VICGHSLGGAIALLLAEGLRRAKDANYNILLYTYGAPRAADSAFTEGASALVHHRIVNHNDPVPSVPAPWMNTTAKIWIPGVVVLFSNPAPGGLLFALGLVRLNGNPYQHHGAQQHFMPIILPRYCGHPAVSPSKRWPVIAHCDSTAICRIGPI